VEEESFLKFTCGCFLVVVNDWVEEIAEVSFSYLSRHPVLTQHVLTNKHTNTAGQMHTGAESEYLHTNTYTYPGPE